MFTIDKKDIIFEPIKNRPAMNSRDDHGCSVTLLVRMAGFEPASFRRQILSLLCMPFHHIRNIIIICYLGYEVNPY